MNSGTRTMLVHFITNLKPIAVAISRDSGLGVEWFLDARFVDSAESASSGRRMRRMHVGDKLYAESRFFENGFAS